MVLSQASINGVVESLESVLEKYPSAHTTSLFMSILPAQSSRSLRCQDAAGDVVRTDRQVFNLTKKATTALRKEHPQATMTLEISLDRDGHWEAHHVNAALDNAIINPITFTEQIAELPPLSLEEHQELNDLWEKGSTDFNTREGVSAEDKQRLENYLGHPIPEPLLALLTLSDGAEIKPGNQKDSLTSGWSLLSALDLGSEHQMWAKFAAEGPYTGTVYSKSTPGTMQPRLLHPGWIPFAHDHANNVLAIDLVPGPNGTPGQVIEFGADLHDGPILRADSLVDFLAHRRHTSQHPAITHLTTSQDAENPAQFIRADVPSHTEFLRLINVDTFAVNAVLDLSIKELLIRKVKHLDLHGIIHLPLQTLTISEVESVDLAPLENHPALRNLSIKNVDSIGNIEALSALPALETAALDRSEAVAALQTVCQLELPRHLSLLENIELLRQLPQTESLEVSTITGQR